MWEGCNADSLRGELSQVQRDAVIQRFRIRNLQLLVATDTATRGLDVDDLTHVINYGLPDDAESYIYRDGCTGRAGKTGTSATIINLHEKGKLREIERTTDKGFIVGETPAGKQICERQLIKVIDELEKMKVNEEEITDFMPETYRKLEWLSKEDLVECTISHESNRLLDYYRDHEEIKIPTDVCERNTHDSRERGSRKAAPSLTRLSINLGRMDGFFPSELTSLLNSNARGRVELERIDLMKNFSFFGVEEKEARNVAKALNRANQNGRKVSVEVTGEETGEGRRDSGSAERRGGKRPFGGSSEKRGDSNRNSRPERSDGAPQADGTIKGSDKTSKKRRSGKPSREERGYRACGPKKTDDWQQFFKDKELDFSEEGRVRRKPKKK